ncbi:hydroxyacylglutathione hydrolase [Methylocystis heyeri]|uniref:Hydroxyacylglutathione hydrolase n=1 Tax=Methylocystis heyeri TaxID=391905 RepID=A0A6B8KA87_9HYPH|nr:hydroxyacylglutathione hydrolase [Methylocystis heyeri]QGM44647.1 hydroxyacylglutathione hydrolase [Methylocystis heyeri]
MAVEIHQFICLDDNFGLLVHDGETGATASVDAPDGDAIAEEAKRLGWRLTHALLTHHHLDHIEGVPALRAAFPEIKVCGARKDAYRIDGLDVLVEEGDAIEIGAARALVLETPGHTTGHLAYHFSEDEAVFVGDTLFSLGCGRVFEGTMATMYGSLERLASLPDETRVYCGHEYTKANARFALTVDPENPSLADRAQNVDALRAAGRFTLPTTIMLERATNPFLRCEDPLVQRAMGMSDSDPVEVFAKMRERKNNFRA